MKRVRLRQQGQAAGAQIRGIAARGPLLTAYGASLEGWRPLGQARDQGSARLLQRTAALRSLTNANLQIYLE